MTAPPPTSPHALPALAAPSARRRLLAFLLLIALALAAHFPVVFNKFVSFDDKDYIYENKMVEQGINAATLKWAFTEVVVANYHPITLLSHLIDGQLFGLNPAGHHAMSLALHALNAILLTLVLHRFTGWFYRSLAVGALFAVHPIHVESIAWASDRKDTLSFAFAMLTLLAYKHWLDRRTLPRYALILLAYLLALLSKPTVITLPALMLLLDYWPLNRSGCHGSASEPTRVPNQTTPSNPPTQNPEPTTQDNSSSPSSSSTQTQDAARKTQDDLPPTSSPSTPDPELATRDSSFLPALKNYLRALPRLLIEKIPIFLVTLLGSITVFMVQRSASAVVDAGGLPLGARLLNAVFAYARYLGKLVLPFDLSIMYPHPTWWPAWYILVSAIILIALTAAVFYLANRFDKRYLPVGWLWFLGVMVPMIGIIQVGQQALADRYAYITFPGLYILLVWGAADLLSRFSPKAAPILLAAAIIPLTIVSNIQTRYWKDSQTLFTRAIAVTGPNPFAQCSLGNELVRQKLFREAIPHYQAAVEYEPTYADAWSSLGLAYGSINLVDEAEMAYEKALSLNPSLVSARINIAIIYKFKGRVDEAAAILTKLSKDKPELPEPYFYLAQIAADQGRLPQAIALYDKSIALDPSDAQVYNSRGILKARLSDILSARDDFARAVQLDPNLADARQNLQTANNLLQQQPRP